MNGNSHKVIAHRLANSPLENTFPRSNYRTPCQLATHGWQRCWFPYLAPVVCVPCISRCSGQVGKGNDRMANASVPVPTQEGLGRCMVQLVCSVAGVETRCDGLEWSSKFGNFQDAIGARAANLERIEISVRDVDSNFVFLLNFQFTRKQLWSFFGEIRDQPCQAGSRR